MIDRIEGSLGAGASGKSDDDASMSYIVIGAERPELLAMRLSSGPSEEHEVGEKARCLLLPSVHRYNAPSPRAIKHIAPGQGLYRRAPSYPGSTSWQTTQPVRH